MKRRECIALAGLMTTGAGCTGVLQQESCSTDGKEFGFISHGFESISWVNGNLLQISFAEDHDMDMFGIRHEHLDDVDDTLIYQAAPKFGGDKIVRFISEIQNAGSQYPTQKFTLTAYKGNNMIVEETLGSVTFCIPKQIAPSANFKDV